MDRSNRGFEIIGAVFVVFVVWCGVGGGDKGQRKKTSNSSLCCCCCLLFFFPFLSFPFLGIVNGEDESKLLQDASRDIGFVLIRTCVASSACFPSPQSHRCPVVSRQRLP